LIAPISRTATLHAVFFLSGMPALMYQVIWQRVLSQHFGVDIYSTTITVATFMLGLGLGSLAGGQLADRSARPRRWYAACELTLGLFGLASLKLFGTVGAALAGSRLAVVAPVSFCLLLAPTFLMGMTLPLICQAIRTADDQIGRHFSRLYALNTAGAAAGAALTAYLLIGLLGLDGATWLAAGLNLALALTVALLGAEPATARPAVDRVAGKAPVAVWALAGLAFLSGFVALGYEIVGYRLLSCLLHGTVYVFGTLLFFFLCGIAGGSWAAHRHVDRARPLTRFALAQLALALYLAGFFTILGRLSWLPGLRHLIAASSLITFHPAPELAAGQLDLPAVYSALDITLWAVLFFGPPAALMGYGLPHLMRSATGSVARLGRSVGGLYLANILGSTAGSLVVGFATLHWIGSERTLAVLVVAGCATTVLAFAVQAALEPQPGGKSWSLAAATLAAASVFLLPAPGQLLAAVQYADSPAVEFRVAEDRSGVVALRRQRAVVTFAQEERLLGIWRLLIDGSGHGQFESDEVELDPNVRLALAAHPAPRRVLSIGLGDGKMAAAALATPEVDKLVVVELNGALHELLASTPQGRYLEASGKLRLIHDDGRRWVQAHPDETFDFITLWPLHAAHAYSGNLYSREFLETLASRLSDSGLLYLRTADSYSTARTLATVFPHLVRISVDRYVAGRQPFRFDPRRAALDGETIAGLLQADRQLILDRTVGAPLNRDLRPNAEYYLTYPWAGILTTWGERTGGYGIEDPGRFDRWIAAAEPSG
jgi:predicted membrane-bound spermidine synthase